jgi:hypothetical protein
MRAVSVFHLVIRVKNGTISVPTLQRWLTSRHPSVYQSSEKIVPSLSSHSPASCLFLCEISEISELSELSGSWDFVGKEPDVARSFAGEAVLGMVCQIKVRDERDKRDKSRSRVPSCRSCSIGVRLVVTNGTISLR